MVTTRSLMIMVLILFMLSILSCRGADHWVGKYEAEMAKNQEVPTILLELMADGRGSWTVREETASFKWEIRKNEMWLHTKSGGVIVGRLKGDTIEVDLPGLGGHLFKRLRR